MYSGLRKSMVVGVYLRDKCLKILRKCVFFYARSTLGILLLNNIIRRYYIL